MRNLIPRLLSLATHHASAEIQLLCDSNQSRLVGDTEPSVKIDAPTSDLSAWKRAMWERSNIPKIVERHSMEVVFTPYQILNARPDATNVIMVRNMEPFFFQRYPYQWKGKIRNQLLRLATRRSLKQADKVIAVSDFVKDYLAKNQLVSDQRVSRVYHGRDEFFSMAETERKSTEAPFVLTGGSLLPYRRCEDVIAAFARLNEDQRFQEYELRIAGQGTEPGYRSMLEKKVEETGLGDRIHFLGHVDKSRMKKLFQQCEVCVLASEIEACPNLAIEAMSCGSPILAARTPPLPEVIGDAAVYFEPRDVTQLAETLRELLVDPERRLELRRRTQDQARKYDWDRCAQETLQILAAET